jgi:hypothetical protein
MSLPHAHRCRLTRLAQRLPRGETRLCQVRDIMLRGGLRVGRTCGGRSTKSAIRGAQGAIGSLGICICFKRIQGNLQNACPADDERLPFCFAHRRFFKSESLQ